MKCPIDNAELHMTERQGVEIDYCPQCRGVWLDRGELDKIIGRGGDHHAPPTHRGMSSAHHERKYDDDSYNDHTPHKEHKRENFLRDLFDF
jgi:uncharacterized protein